MKNVIITSVLALMLATGASAKNIYVSPDGSTSNNGNSWESPISDLGTAYSKASKGDVIFMAAGTYTVNATINMVEGVNVYGGFAKGETSIEDRVRPNAATEPWKFTNETIITSGKQNFRLVDRVDKETFWENTIIDGITFKDNVSTDSRVLYLRNSVTLQNCQILDNACTKTIVYGEENTHVRNCYFAGNKSADAKAEVSTLQLRGCHKTYYPGSTLEDCLFEGNEVTSLSLYNENSEGAVGDQDSNEDGVWVTRATFRNNKANCVQVNNKWTKRYLRVTHCLFEGNESAAEGTVFSGNSSSTDGCEFAYNIVRNNTNTAPVDSWRYGIISARSGMNITNCLIVNNSSDKLLIDLQGCSVFNSTIANNKGTVYADAYATIANSVLINNEATHKNASVYAAGGSFVDYSGTDTEILGDGMETITECLVETTPFVKPTSFLGLATSETEKQELEDADFSLNPSSAFVNTGYAEYFEDFSMTEEWMETFMSKDIAGNDRIVDGQINMGAYQGGKGTGVYEVNDAVECAVEVDGYTINVSSASRNAKASLYNLNGTALDTKDFVGNTTLTVMEQGLYLVKVVVDNQVKNFKVLIK